MMKHIPHYSRVMRIAAWMWLIYLACLGLVDIVIYFSFAEEGDSTLKKA